MDAGGIELPAWTKALGWCGIAVPLWCAQTLADIAVDRKWVVAVYLVAGFIVLPAPVIILVGVL